MKRFFSTYLLLLSVVFGCASARALELQFEPYLQGLTSRSVTIRAFTDGYGPITLVLKGSQKELRLESTGTDHEFRISGLEANHRYRYVLIEGTRELARPRSFRTAPLRTSPQRFRMAVFGDSGSASEAQMRIAVEIEKTKPELMLHTGDIVYENGEFRDYHQKFFRPYAKLLPRIPFFPSVGNHDARTIKDYERIYSPPSKSSASGTKRYYSFDYGFVHFISLDSCLSLAPDSWQAQWLIRDLENRRKGIRATVIFFHHPPFSKGEHGDTTRLHGLLPIFEKFGVNLVLSGHDHCYERSEPVNVSGKGSKVLYLVTGGGGNRLYGERHESSNIIKYEMQHHFVSLFADRRALTGKVINVKGEVIDEFRVALR